MANSTDASKIARDFYSVEWPADWAINDLTSVMISQDRSHDIEPRENWPELVSWVGGHPKGQVTFYQHAIAVSRAPKSKLVTFIKKNSIVIIAAL